MSQIVLTITLLVSLLYVASGNKCPVDVVSCVNTTCCKLDVSTSGYGCCPAGIGSTCCMNSTDGSGRCCPAGTTCSKNGDVITCVGENHPSSGALYTCKPGPEFPPSSSLPNCIIMGDSVSIGYTPYVAQILNKTCYVQHTPWDVSSGGAVNTGYGLECLDTFLRTAEGYEAKWDLIQYNFGLHDINANTEDSYAQQLEAITKKLVATGAKILYATTTPAPYDMGAEGAKILNDLNNIARNITTKYNVPVSDLYGRVTSFCGVPPYANCSICLKQPCSFHYNPTGYEYIAKYAAQEITNLLAETKDNSHVLSAY